jgi:glycerol-1-phosphate dehydrogenase [NAD(P)+]
LTVAEIQERILAIDKISIKPTQIDEGDLNKVFDKSLAEHFFKEIKNKFIDQNFADKINAKLDKEWLEVRSQLSKCHISKSKLLELYKRFSLPETANDIQIDNEIYWEAVANAHLIRNRFTSLDFIKLI